ncbi:hypothetical protein PYW08_014957 [Mythimna loreyi]|uniref:Uncharacterized protein n=1 Tax=Mythimna loreyi TaxID=667449 RepID=A0ACC2R5W1_9NEOP|nr:hypothetical protein PYW08_014957 [Mythimna loreyi]
MAEEGKCMTRKLLDLMQETGYPLVQHNGQRRFGPPPNWTGPPPQKGCEVFIGKLPREIFEDELVPVFSRVGKIYEMRLMMDFSGSNRGYAFVTYSTKSEASRAVKELNGIEIRPRRHIGVVKSVDNCRLFVGNIPKTKSKEEVFEELSKRVDGIVDLILYKNCYDKRLNRGFAFVEFSSHRAAAMARRALVPGCVKIWDQEVMVDWAEPEPDVDDEQMQRVLYARNFQIKTTPETIQAVFEAAINNQIERVKKIYDYAFIHFYQREHAEYALEKLQNMEIDGSNIEIRWAKPVVREIYRIQKMNRGNAKFNNSFNLSQTLLLYKQQLEKKEFIPSPTKEDEGIGSGGAGQSSCGSSLDMNSSCYPYTSKDQYSMAPAKLDSMCKRYMWAAPIYNYQKYIDPTNTEIWICRVELPHIGKPLLSVPRQLGPLQSRPCYSMQQAHIEAAESALQVIKMLKADLIQQSMPPPPPLAPVYPSIMSPMPSCINLPYDYMSAQTAIYQPRPMPVTMPIWRNV